MDKEYDRYIVVDMIGGTLPDTVVGTYPSVKKAKEAAEDYIINCIEKGRGKYFSQEELETARKEIADEWALAQLKGGHVVSYEAYDGLPSDEMIIIPVPKMD